MTHDLMIAEFARALRRALLDEMAADAQNAAYLDAVLREDEREETLRKLSDQ